MQITILPMWPAFILIGFFFGLGPLLWAWGIATVVAALHHFEFRLHTAALALTAVAALAFYISLPPVP